MKKIIFIILAVIVGFMIKIPEYEELNSLAIIEGIGVSYNNKKYTIYLKEVIPIKSEQGINYEYAYYKEDGENIEDAYKKLQTKAKKKLYIKRCKFLVTNLKHSDNIQKVLNIKPDNIYHPSIDIYKFLKAIE